MSYRAFLFSTVQSSVLIYNALTGYLTGYRVSLNGVCAINRFKIKCLRGIKWGRCQLK